MKNVIKRSKYYFFGLIAIGDHSDLQHGQRDNSDNRMADTEIAVDNKSPKKVY